MFDIGSVFRSVAQTVPPPVGDAGTGPTLGKRQHEADAVPSTDIPMQVADPLASYVASNGLHSIATADFKDLPVTKVHDCSSQKLVK